MFPKPNAVSQYVDSNQHGFSENNKSVSMRSEQIFNDRSKQQTSDKQNKSTFVPYNVTPHIKLHEPIKTKLTQQERLNQSVQEFNVPAEHSRAEIGLLEQSMEKQAMVTNPELLDQLKYPRVIEEPKLAQFPQLFSEPPILIPYLLEFVQWNPEIIQNVSNAQGDYVEVFLKMKKTLKEESEKIDHKFRTARDVYDFLDAQLDIRSKLNSLVKGIHEQWKKCRTFFVEANNEELKQQGWVPIQNQVEESRRQVYLLRKRCLQLMALCDHQEDTVLHVINFEDTFHKSKAGFLNNYDVFVERILVYVLMDDLGIEKVMLHYREDKFPDCEEVQFIKEMHVYNECLEDTAAQLRDIVKQFDQYLREIVADSTTLLNQIASVMSELELNVNQVTKLFVDIPTMMEEVSCVISESQIFLYKIKIPFANFSQDNEILLSDYLLRYEQCNQELEQIKEIINQQDVKYAKAEQQKAALTQELSLVGQQNQQVYNLYQLCTQISSRESQLFKMQQKRIEVWLNNKTISNIDLQNQNNKELEVLANQCNLLVTDISQFFGQERLPYQFIRLKQWCLAEYQALQLRSEKTFVVKGAVTVEDRIHELMKWEHTQAPQEGENGEIVTYLSYLYDLDTPLNNQVQPQIDRDIAQQFPNLEGEQYYKLLQLNEQYNIWKHMQVAGIFLHIDFILNLLIENKPNKLDVFVGRVQQLLMFFKLNNQDTYTKYITEILLMMQHIKSKQFQEAIRVVNDSKVIPRIFKQPLLEQLNILSK